MNDKNMILVVEDDRNIGSILQYTLDVAEYDAVVKETGEDAIHFVVEHLDEIALILMDVMLPKMDGYSATREIRKIYSGPIIMLTALGEENDKVQAFESGADDYITKPFGMRELMARVKRKVEREAGIDIQGNHNLQSTYKNYGIVFDDDVETVEIAGKRIELSKTEYALFKFFVKCGGKVPEKETLFQEVWGTVYIAPRTLDVTVHRLRSKIEPDEQNPTYIKTRRGRGYYFAPANP